MKKIFGSIMLLICFSGIVVAQTVREQVYYVNLNASAGNVYDVPGEVLALQFNDTHGKWKDIPVRIYDWQRNVVASMSFDKGLGLNKYVIVLPTVYSGWRLNETYIFELKDEGGNRYELPFRLIVPLVAEAPEVSIVVDPETPSCDGLNMSVVKFYGDIRGGRAPYIVNWYIINEHRTDFLYQPREEYIEKAGKTMAVIVDKAPNYYVMLEVKDACGNIRESVVNLICEDGIKKINSVFFEELHKPLGNKLPGQ